jgi:hypothetical protein
MARIPESFKAFQYHAGIDNIRAAFRASATTLENAQMEAELAYAHWASMGVDGRVYDDEGTIVDSVDAKLAAAESDGLIQVRLVREAFITTAYHYWERSAKTWCNIQGFINFQTLSARSSTHYPLSPQLSNLNRLNNLLKHDTSRIDPRLLRDRPDYFHSGLFTLKPGEFVRNPELQVQHEHVEEAFKIVRASGPAYPHPRG